MKVHFACSNYGEQTLAAGVRYRLASFFDQARRGGVDPPDVLARYRHVIIDSGLFTLMFGSERESEFTMDDALAWQREYVRYAKSLDALGERVSFVELDVQKKLGPEAAWELRRRFREDMGSRQVITVYHLEDGDPSALLDFASYVAVSQPELRKAMGARERERLTRCIAARAVALGKRVHLLGLTSVRDMRAFRFCTSCDSTSWTKPFRWGYTLGGAVPVMHVSEMRRRLDAAGADGSNEYWAARLALIDYKRHAGPQD